MKPRNKSLLETVNLLGVCWTMDTALRCLAKSLHDLRVWKDGKLTTFYHVSGVCLKCEERLKYFIM